MKRKKSTTPQSTEKKKKQYIKYLEDQLEPQEEEPEEPAPENQILPNAQFQPKLLPVTEPPFQPELTEDLVSEGGIIESEAPSIVIPCEFVPPSETSTDVPPLVVDFKQGPPSLNIFDPSHHMINYYEITNFEKEITDPKIVIKTEKLKYIGTKNNSDTSKDFAIGIFDKTTNTLKIVPIEQVFGLRQSIRGFKEDIADNKFLGLEYGDQRDKLNVQFATPKRVRAHRAMKENKLSQNNVVGVEDMLEEVHAQLPPEIIAKENDSFPDLPIFNPQATSPAEVFPINLLIPTEEINMMTDADDYISHLGESKDIILQRVPHCPKYVIKLIMELLVKDTQENRIQCTHLKYYTHLFNFYKITSGLKRLGKIGRKKFEDISIPKPLSERFLSKFGIPQSDIKDKNTTYQFPLDLKNKLINHLMIVALSLKNYRVHLPDIELEFGISHRRLITHLRRVGCTISKDTAILVAPPRFASLIPGRKS